MTTATHPVSERAVLARLKRALAKHDWTLRKCRMDARDYWTVGDYYIIDDYTGGMNHCNIDIESWAREEGVLHATEHMVATN